MRFPAADLPPHHRPAAADPREERGASNGVSRWRRRRGRDAVETTQRVGGRALGQQMATGSASRVAAVALGLAATTLGSEPPPPPSILFVMAVRAKPPGLLRCCVGSESVRKPFAGRSRVARPRVSGGGARCADRYGRGHSVPGQPGCHWDHPHTKLCVACPPSSSAGTPLTRRCVARLFDRRRAGVLSYASAADDGPVRPAHGLS